MAPRPLIAPLFPGPLAPPESLEQFDRLYTNFLALSMAEPGILRTEKPAKTHRPTGVHLEATWPEGQFLPDDETKDAESPVIGRVNRIYAALRDVEVVLNRLADKLTPVLTEAHSIKEDEAAREATDSPLATHLNSIEYRVALLNRGIQELTARVDL